MYQMKKGGSSKSIKKYAMGGQEGPGDGKDSIPSTNNFFKKLDKKPQSSSKVMSKEEVKKRTVSDKLKVPTPGIINNFNNSGTKISLKKGGQVNKTKKKK